MAGRLGTAIAQTQTFSDPVGFITLTAVGTNGLGSPAYSFLGLGMTRIPALRGVVGTVAGTQVPLDSTLTLGQYNSTSNGPLYYIELTSGTSSGFTDDIVSNDAANVYTATDDSSVISTGNAFKIFPHWTLGSLFGTNDSAGLKQGGATTADQILIQDPATPLLATFYYNNVSNKTLTPGWRAAGAGGNTDQSQTPFYND